MKTTSQCNPVTLMLRVVPFSNWQRPDLNPRPRIKHYINCAVDPRL